MWWYEWRQWGDRWSFTGTCMGNPINPKIKRYPNTQLFPTGADPNMQQTEQQQPPALTQGAIDWHKARIAHADTLLIKLARMNKPNLQSVSDYLKHHRTESERAIGIEDDTDW